MKRDTFWKQPGWKKAQTAFPKVWKASFASPSYVFGKNMYWPFWWKIFILQSLPNDLGFDKIWTMFFVCKGKVAWFGHFFFRRHLVGNYSGPENHKYCRWWAHVWSSKLLQKNQSWPEMSKYCTSLYSMLTNITIFGRYKAFKPSTCNELPIFVQRKNYPITHCLT